MFKVVRYYFLLFNNVDTAYFFLDSSRSVIDSVSHATHESLV